MLTIQPKFTNYTASKAISFKADGDETSDREEFYKEKVDFYKKQAEEFKEMEKDRSNPESFSKIMKVFRVVSEALLEGWAVAWGASKGSKLLKSSVISASKTNFVKGVKDILRPIYKGIKSSGKKIAEAYSNTITKIKTSKFAEKIEKFVNGMRENPIGKYIVNGFEYIGKGFKFVGKIIKAGAKKLAEPFKGKTKSEVYDKATKFASNTLGFGAGGAGAYNAATDAEKRKAEQNSNIDNNDEELFEYKDEDEPNPNDEVEE